MATITKLYRGGILSSSVELDEITYDIVKISPFGVYASEFDEIEIQGNIVAERRTSDGRLLVSGYFNEVDEDNSPITSIISITPTTVTRGKVNEFYTFNFLASGGESPYTYQLISGSLPSGVAFSSTGVLQGTPVIEETQTFAIRVTDNQSITKDQQYILIIDPQETFEVVITLLPANLTSFVSGQSYSQLITAQGGQSPYTFTLDSGALPAGLTLDSNGLLYGTPHLDSLEIYPQTLSDVVSGSVYSERVFASNGISPYTFELASGDLPPGITLSSDGRLQGTAYIEGLNLVLTPIILADAVNGSSYEATISALNGQIPYTFTLESGILPPNLTLNSNGTISGTVQDNLLLFPSSLPSANNGDSYSATITASNGVTPFTFALANGELPPGLSIDSNGNITGTILE